MTGASGVPDQNDKNTAKERRRRAPNTPPSAYGLERLGRAPKSSETIRADLRRDIVSLKLTPGTPVSEKELAQRYGVSRTPVREALLQLSEERLVEVIPRSGTFVSRIPLSVLRESMAARIALEGVTVRAASETASTAQIAKLNTIIRRQRKEAAAANESAFHVSDEDFHLCLATIGNYPGIWGLVQQAKAHIDRCRRLTLPQPGRMNLVIEEHSAIVDAVARHDADEAETQMEAHLNKLKFDIAVFRDRWPQYFIHDLDFDNVTRDIPSTTPSRIKRS
ncbi:MAG: GntR family transcriptional regulator [Alphaproteobacteria bacterium]